MYSYSKVVHFKFRDSMITCTGVVALCLNFDDLLHSGSYVCGFVSDVTL